MPTVTSNGELPDKISERPSDVPQAQTVAGHEHASAAVRAPSPTLKFPTILLKHVQKAVSGTIEYVQ